MHEGERRLDALVAEVGEELAELRRGEHALVDERAAREGREVHLHPTISPVGGAGVGHLVLTALAHHEQLAIELDARRATFEVVDENLTEARDHAPGGGADHRRVDRHLAPAEHAEPFLVDDPLDLRHRLLAERGVERQEREAHP